MSVRTVHNDRIDASVRELKCTVHIERSDGGSYPEFSVPVTVGFWILLFFQKVLHRDDPGQSAFVIDDRQALDLFGVHHVDGVVCCDIVFHRDRFTRHDCLNRFGSDFIDQTANITA